MKSDHPVLLILAAGLGSRYGGLKQLETFGPSGETIVDFSIADALEAGFRRLVFVIRKSFENEFKQKICNRWQGRVLMDFVFQELDVLPDGYCCPPDRLKPWGTGHAVWVAKQVIRGPFGVINADDYYGKEAMQRLYDFLENGGKQSDVYGVIAYSLKNTISEFGAVNRGICEAAKDGFLRKIAECRGITKNDQGIFYERGHQRFFLDENTLVSMNMWAFQVSYFPWAETYFMDFLNDRGRNANEEFYIPDLIQHLIDSDRVKVLVIKSGSDWFGVTYQADKPAVQKAFRDKINRGEFPIFADHGGG